MVAALFGVVALSYYCGSKDDADAQRFVPCLRAWPHRSPFSPYALQCKLNTNDGHACCAPPPPAAASPFSRRRPAVGLLGNSRDRRSSWEGVAGMVSQTAPTLPRPFKARTTRHAQNMPPMQTTPPGILARHRTPCASTSIARNGLPSADGDRPWSRPRNNAARPPARRMSHHSCDVSGHNDGGRLFVIASHPRIVRRHGTLHPLRTPLL